MEVIFGLVTALLVAYLDAAIAMANSGNFVHSFTLLIVVPIVALVFGAVASSGVPTYLYWASKPLACRSFLASVVCAMFALVAGYYFLYNSTYVYGGELNFDHQGSRISELTYADSGARVTFPRFASDLITSSSSTFYFRGRAIGTVSSPGWSWLKFILIAAGYGLGGVTSVSLLANRGYCEDCQRYKTKKSLPSLDLMYWTLKREEILSPVAQPTSWNANRASPNRNQLKAVLRFCPDCLKGSLELTPRVRTKDGYKELSGNAENLDVTPEFVSWWRWP